MLKRFYNRACFMTAYFMTRLFYDRGVSVSHSEDTQTIRLLAPGG